MHKSIGGHGCMVIKKNIGYITIKFVLIIAIKVSK